MACHIACYTNTLWMSHLKTVIFMFIYYEYYKSLCFLVLMVMKNPTNGETVMCKVMSLWEKWD